jgi:hypothetical protein
MMKGDGIPDLTEQDVESGRFFVGLMTFGLPGGTWGAGPELHHVGHFRWSGSRSGL